MINETVNTQNILTTKQTFSGASHLRSTHQGLRILQTARKTVVSIHTHFFVSHFLALCKL